MTSVINLLMKVYNRAHSRKWVICIEQAIKMFIDAPSDSVIGKTWDTYLETCVSKTIQLDISKILIKDVDRYLTSMAIVLRSHSVNQKGVLLLKYSYAFPLLMFMFDVNKIMSRYVVVLEPSWTGYCDAAILGFARYSYPVYVQSLEPKDSEMLLNVSKNITPVAIGSNWWVDHRIFRPRPDVLKDADLCMNASWSKFKRHEEIFQCVSNLRKQGRSIKLVLIGYSIGEMTSDDIKTLTKKYNIADQVEIYEKIPSEQVALNMARCKANIVWSKREGVNRAIIEGFMCDVPGILREGFNYGHRYDYINNETGLFSAPSELDKNVLNVIDNYQSFKPRNWVMNNMTCLHACEVLQKQIDGSADCFESGRISSKVNTLDKMEYFNKEDSNMFVNDYDYLKSCYRRRLATNLV